MYCSVNVLERLALQRAASLFQYASGGAELLIGDALLFVPLAVTTKVRAEELRSSFDLFHGLRSMPLVIVVRLGERDVSLAQKFDRRCPLGLQGLTCDQHQS